MADVGAKKNVFAAPGSANHGLPLSGPDIRTIFASHYKNVEAMMQASRLSFDGVQAVWHRQLDFIREAVDGLATLASDFAQPSDPLNQKFAKHADYSKRALEKNLANARKLTELAAKATNDAMSVFNQLFREGLGEMRRSRETWDRWYAASTDPASDR